MFTIRVTIEDAEGRTIGEGHRLVAEIEVEQAYFPSQILASHISQAGERAIEDMRDRR